MQAINPYNITVDKVILPELAKRNVHIDLLRLDKIHPVISGNKWFKLRYYLDEAVHAGTKHIITFGGAWSNHIVAAAAACKMKQLRCTGIIRGEEPSTWSATLAEAKAYGMDLHFSTRQDYANKIIPAASANDNARIIPEGGYGPQGAKGASSILDYCDGSSYEYICCAAGTGTMAAGIINAAADKKVLAFSVLKNNHDLKPAIDSLLTADKKFELNDTYHFGGYAKHEPRLLAFMNHFFSHTHIPLDFVYTGKLLFGVTDLIRNGYFSEGSRILVIHSGGLQGNASLPKGTLIF